jgi:hypothetical protein
LAVDSANRQKAAGLRQDSITETSFDSGASMIVFLTQSQHLFSLFSCSITASTAKLNCGLLGSWTLG